MMLVQLILFRSAGHKIYILKSHNNIQGASVYIHVWREVGEGVGEILKRNHALPQYSQYMRINVPLHNNLAV